MIITAHQPLYMPWLGFFHKMILADTICILDDVQFSDGDNINRNKIKTQFGTKWLTVPVKKKNHLSKQIRQIEIADLEWKNRHLALIRQSYSKTAFFSSYIDSFDEIINGTNYQYLIDLDMVVLKFLLRELGINTNIIMSSELNIKETKSDLILSICQELGADVYISGQNGPKYLNVEDFKGEKKQIMVQQYRHPNYSQSFGDFIPNLSVIDLLFNYGPQSRDIIMQGNPKSWNELPTV